MPERRIADSIAMLDMALQITRIKKAGNPRTLSGLDLPLQLPQEIHGFHGRQVVQVSFF